MKEGGRVKASEVGESTLLEMWRGMLRIRRFEEEATRLLRSGQMPGVLHNATGQEAVVVGVCAGMEPQDVFVGTHRNHGYPIARGAGLRPLMAEVLGRREGMCHGKAGEMHLIAPESGVLFNSAILASGVPFAVGTAVSAQMQHTGAVTVATYGDGASNEGAIHEAMNLAAIWKAPVVFVCENNGYAVTVPASYAVSVENLADRARSYGMPGVTVDGHDPRVVARAVRAQVERARAGTGPSLVEVKTYRIVDHAENLPSQPYRAEDEVAYWRDRDPVAGIRAMLVREGQASEQDLEAISQEVEAEIEEAIRFGLDSPLPDASELWEDLFVDPALNRDFRYQEA